MRFCQAFIALSLLAVRFAIAVPAEDSQAAGAVQQAGAEHAAAETVASVHADNSAEAGEDIQETLLEEEGDLEQGPEVSNDKNDHKADAESKKEEGNLQADDEHRRPARIRYRTRYTTFRETFTLRAKEASPTKDVFDDHHGCNHNIHHFQHHGHKFAPPPPDSTTTVTAVGEPPERTLEPIPNRHGVVTETTYTMIPSIASDANLPFQTTITDRVVYRRKKQAEILIVVYKQYLKMPSNQQNFIVVLPPWYERREESGFSYSWDGWIQRLKYWVRQQDKIYAGNILQRAHVRGKARAIALARQYGGDRKWHQSFNHDGHRQIDSDRSRYRPQRRPLRYPIPRPQPEPAY